MVIERFKQAIRDNDVGAVERLLQSHPSLTERINEPWFVFDAPAIVVAASGGNREMVDVLLEYGADINAKSSWWAGGFGVLHHGHRGLSRYLIDRGALVDPHAAAALGMLEELKKMVEKDPGVVNQRGPDGQVPLHFAESPDAIDFLLAHGADIDRRDIDHNSTPAQYAVNNPDTCRHLLQRGARADIFMACKLGEIELLRNILKANPDALQAQVGRGEFTSGESDGGHIYEYNIGAGARPLILAARIEDTEFTELMLSYCSTEQKFLFACLRADRETVPAMLLEHRDIVQSLQQEDQSVIADAAGDRRADAVRLMLEVGFHADARRNERSMTALHRAALRGDLEIVRLLIAHGASVDILNEFGGNPMGSCIWGSSHFRDPLGDYASVAEGLIEAGVKLPNQAAGSEAVKKVLIRHGVQE